MAYIKRAFENLDKYRRKGRVTVIHGARRTGKTTLVRRYLLNKNKENVLNINGDNVNDRSKFLSEDARVLNEWVKGYDIIFIDEAQKIEKIGIGLKILIDNNEDKNIIATGSSSFDLKGKLGEPLTGRQIPLSLYPLSVHEIENIENRVIIKDNFEKMLIYGLYPEVFVEKDEGIKKILLNELVDAYLLKDIFELEHIKKPDALLNLLRLLAFQISGEVSLNELSNKLSVDIKTVSRYLELLEKTFVIYKLKPFIKNRRNEIVSKSKYYFYDTGIRNAIIQNFNPLDLRDDVGGLFENFIVMERLKKRSYANIHRNSFFWRGYQGGEIDLIEEGEGKIVAYEIKFSQKKTVKFSKAFQENYPDAILSVINSDNFIEKDFL
jgi:predicted AAA+ superfamily ATPase